MDYEQLYFKYKGKYLDLKKRREEMEDMGQIGSARTKYGLVSTGTLFPIQDEVFFWGTQMKEHALFLYLGLEDDVGKKGTYKLKNKASEIHNDWGEFMKDTYGNLSPAVTLEGQDLSKFEVNKQRLEKLLNELIVFKEKVLGELNGGKWIGWIYPSMVKHMIKEAGYFKRKLNGPAFTDDEEIKFSNQHQGEEMAVTAQLIDPMPEQQSDIELVRAYGNKKMSEIKSPLPPTVSKWTPADEELLKGMISSPTNISKLLEVSKRYGQEITNIAKLTGDRIKRNDLKTIISTILAEHTYREYARFTLTLDKISQRSAYRQY